MSIASIQNLTVRYKSFTALDGLTCSVSEGCTGLLGPNGAGKTTLLKTILGFVKPVSGTATVLGRDVVAQGKEIRQLVGLMPEQDCHIPGMTAVQFVAYAGELAGMPPAQALRRTHEVLEYCGLGEARYRNVETYSTGMKQRIKLAQALVHGPKLLLLDEPTNGIDPAGREEMLDLVKDVSHGKGLHVIVSSHLLPDIERVCDQVIVVQKGTVRQQGLMSDIRKLSGGMIDVELKTPNDRFLTEFVALGGEVISAEGYKSRLRKDGPPELVRSEVFKAAHKSNAQVRGITDAVRSLEEAFLEVIK